MNSKKPQRKIWLTVRLPADDWTVIEEAVADGIFAMTMHGGTTGRMAQVNRGFKRALSQPRKKRKGKRSLSDRAKLSTAQLATASSLCVQIMPIPAGELTTNRGT